MIEWIKCFFGCHKYFIIKDLHSYSRKIGCKHCKKEFMMNDDCQSVLVWDSDFDKLEDQIEKDLSL